LWPGSATNRSVAALRYQGADTDRRDRLPPSAQSHARNGRTEPDRTVEVDGRDGGGPTAVRGPGTVAEV
jgi:hypothetical protein